MHHTKPGISNRYHTLPRIHKLSLSSGYIRPLTGAPCYIYNLIPWSYNYLHYLSYQEGRTALLVACWREHYDIVNQLLVAGASPNAQDQVRGCGHNISADSLRISIVIRYNRRAWLHWSLQHKKPVQISSLPWWMQMLMQISQKRLVVWMINIAPALISMNWKDLVSKTYWVIVKMQAPSSYYRT